MPYPPLLFLVCSLLCYRMFKSKTARKMSFVIICIVSFTWLCENLFSVTHYNISFFLFFLETHCPPLTIPDNVYVYPPMCTGTGKLYFGTTCSFFCSDGLTLEGAVAPVSCLSNGTWDRTVNDNTTMACVGKNKQSYLSTHSLAHLTFVFVLAQSTAFPYHIVPDSNRVSQTLLIKGSENEKTRGWDYKEVSQ